MSETEHEPEINETESETKVNETPETKEEVEKCKDETNTVSSSSHEGRVIEEKSLPNLT